MHYKNTKNACHECCDFWFLRHTISPSNISGSIKLCSVKFTYYLSNIVTNDIFRLHLDCNCTHKGIMCCVRRNILFFLLVYICIYTSYLIMLLYLDLYCVCNEMYITYIWVHALSRALPPTISGSGPIHEKKFKMLSNIHLSRV